MSIDLSSAIIAGTVRITRANGAVINAVAAFDPADAAQSVQYFDPEENLVTFDPATETVEWLAGQPNAVVSESCWRIVSPSPYGSVGDVLTRLLIVVLADPKTGDIDALNSRQYWVGVDGQTFAIADLADNDILGTYPRTADFANFRPCAMGDTFNYTPLEELCADVGGTPQPVVPVIPWRNGVAEAPVYFTPMGGLITDPVAATDPCNCETPACPKTHCGLYKLFDRVDQDDMLGSVSTANYAVYLNGALVGTVPIDYSDPSFATGMRSEWYAGVVALLNSIPEVSFTVYEDIDATDESTYVTWRLEITSGEPLELVVLRDEIGHAYKFSFDRVSGIEVEGGEIFGSLELDDVNWFGGDMTTASYQGPCS